MANRRAAGLALALVALRALGVPWPSLGAPHRDGIAPRILPAPRTGPTPIYSLPVCESLCEQPGSLHLASPGACRCSRAHASCTRICTLVTGVHSRGDRGGAPARPRRAGAGCPPILSCREVPLRGRHLSTEPLPGLDSTHSRGPGPLSSLTFCSGTRCFRPALPSACPVTPAANRRGRTGAQVPDCWAPRGSKTGASGGRARAGAGDEDGNGDGGGQGHFSASQLLGDARRSGQGRGGVQRGPGALLCASPGLPAAPGRGREGSDG